MNKLMFPLFFCLSAFTFGCGQDALNTDEPEPARQEVENFTLFTSDKMYNELYQKRSGEAGEEFEITDVSRKEIDGRSYLEIGIMHQSCSPDTRIIWNGRVAESYPPQVFLFVQLLSGEGCTDEDNSGENEEQLLLNLDELFKDDYTVKNAVFHVLNASRKNTDNDHTDNPVQSDGSL